MSKPPRCELSSAVIALTCPRKVLVPSFHGPDACVRASWSFCMCSRCPIEMLPSEPSFLWTAQSPSTRENAGFRLTRETAVSIQQPMQLLQHGARSVHLDLYWFVDGSRHDRGRLLLARSLRKTPRISEASAESLHFHMLFWAGDMPVASDSDELIDEGRMNRVLNLQDDYCKVANFSRGHVGVMRTCQSCHHHVYGTDYGFGGGRGKKVPASNIGMSKLEIQNIMKHHGL
eukprot:6456185-Amphidinium_carterae.2